MNVSSARTVVQAIEDAAASTKTGYRFLDESPSGGDAEPFFTHGGIERASARYGGALMLGGRPVPRLMLHAAALEFPHPDGGRRRIEAPVPVDFGAVLAASALADRSLQ